jgi:hypothetical protein
MHGNNSNILNYQHNNNHHQQHEHHVHQHTPSNIHLAKRYMQQ